MGLSGGSQTLYCLLGKCEFRKMGVLGMDWRIYFVFPHHFQLIWISKGEYDESGPSIVHSSFCELAVCMEIDQSLTFTGLLCFVFFFFTVPTCLAPS